MSEVISSRHAYRRHINQKHKFRDRWKPKGAVWEVIPYHRWRHMTGEKDYTFKRRQTASETGFGVAYEHRPSCEVK